jgi:cystathionine beta-synthase
MPPKRLSPSPSLHVFDDIAGTIGWTPLVRLSRISRGLRCSLYAKLEMFNPGGSVKDRIAMRMIAGFERAGALKPGGTIVEATSGNPGVALAIASALRGYQSVFVMPDKMSDEKIRLLRAYGARVVITPTAVAPEDPRSYYSVARKIAAETPNAVLANQYFNQDNPESHYATTGPEIWEQTAGQVTDVVIGMGTGGTITGVGRFLHEQGTGVHIVGVDPQGSLLQGAWEQGSAEGLEAWPYKVEGIGEDFVPGTMDLTQVDQVVQVDDTESFLWTRRLVRDEGIFAGGSSGSALAGALKYARDLPEERLVVVLLPDSGSRYLSKVFNDDWMRENGFLPVDQRRVSALEVARARGLPALITASQHDRLRDVIALMRQNGIDQLPVLDPQAGLVGMVTEVELLTHMLNSDHEHPPDETIEAMIDRQVRTERSTTPLVDVLPELMQRKVVVLTDEIDRPVGILTIIDALEYLAQLEKHEAPA